MKIFRNFFFFFVHRPNFQAPRLRRTTTHVQNLIAQVTPSNWRVTTTTRLRLTLYQQVLVAFTYGKMLRSFVVRDYKIHTEYLYSISAYIRMYCRHGAVRTHGTTCNRRVIVVAWGLPPILSFTYRNNNYYADSPVCPRFTKPVKIHIFTYYFSLPKITNIVKFFLSALLTDIWQPMNRYNEFTFRCLSQGKGGKYQNSTFKREFTISTGFTLSNIRSTKMKAHISNPCTLDEILLVFYSTYKLN